jgi:hypothetical protein
MLGETRILFLFPSQPAPRPVGCVALFDAAVADRRLGCYCNSVSKATPTAPTYFLTYIHDCYPAHEVYIGHKLIWPWSPNDHSIGNIAACLSGARSRFQDRTQAQSTKGVVLDIPGRVRHAFQRTKSLAAGGASRGTTRPSGRQNQGISKKNESRILISFHITG